MRWKPFPIPGPEKPTDFVEGTYKKSFWHPLLPFCPQSTTFHVLVGLITVCGAGDPSMKEGMAIHIYCANTDMKDKAFYNSDGDCLLGTFRSFV